MSDSKDFFTLGAAVVSGIVGLISTGLAIKTKFDCDKALDENKLSTERFANSTTERFSAVDRVLNDHDRAISSLSRTSDKHEKMLKKHSKNFEVLSKSQSRMEREFRKCFKDDDRDIRIIDRKVKKLEEVYKFMHSARKESGKKSNNP